MIFRKEAVNNKIWQGRAIAIPGTPLWLVMSVSVLFIFVIFVFSITGNYTRRIKVEGEVSSYPPNGVFIFKRARCGGRTVCQRRTKYKGR